MRAGTDRRDGLGRSGEGDTPSLARCRQLLGPRGASISDDQLREIRASLRLFAQLAVDAFFSGGRQSTSADSLNKQVAAMLPEPDRGTVDERAAIFEHEAGLNKDEAERKAIAAWIDANR